MNAADSVSPLILRECPATADRAGWRAIMTDPSLVRLHEAKAAHAAFAGYEGNDDQQKAILCEAQALAFWAMVDAKPSSIVGALEIARFMLVLHQDGVALNVRNKEAGAGEDIPALALDIILSAFGADPQEDPAVAASLEVWAAWSAWGEINDAQINTPAEKRLAARFNEAVEALASITPTSAMGAGMMAQVMSWCAFSECVDKRQLRNTLSSIATAFAPPREEELTDEATSSAAA